MISTLYKPDIKYKICTKTVMDNIADPDISFDEKGVCNYYYEFKNKLTFGIPSKADSEKQIQKIIFQIKKQGANKKYDCIIGVNGGVDSSYVTYLVKKMGLRPLAVHLDNGWDSELAVKNIEKVLKTLDIDLHTIVLDWDKFKDLQLSFLKASVPDIEIPSDHIINAAMYEVANRFGIRYILSGMNFRTEGLLPSSWARGYLDWKYIKSVHNQFGSTSLQSFPHLSIGKLFYLSFIKGIRVINILNYVDLDKKNIVDILKNELGYQPYSGKHHESIYTRFLQSYILPKKFGIDKRKAHYTCQIIGTGEITREEALHKLRQPFALPQQILDDKEYVIKKLGITETEFENILHLPVKSILDYPNNYKLEQLFRKVLNMLRKKGMAPK